MGMAERQYSVSVPRQRASTGPNPMEKRSTPTPDHRATTKWPSSWIRIRTPMTTMNETIVVTGLTASARGDESRDAPARVGVDRHAIVDRRARAGRHGVERALDQFWDSREPDLSVEEGRHRHLVGGVEHHRRGPALLEGGPREPDAREALHVRGEEG